MHSPNHVLCIRGLSEQDAESEIYSLLSKYGTLTHLEIIRLKDNKGKKNAIVHYQQQEQADFARASLHNQKFGSNYLFVDYYDPYSKTISPSQIQTAPPTVVPVKDEQQQQYLSFIREKKAEKKIIKFTETDGDRRSEKTTLYTKKNLEKMISCSSKLPSQQQQKEEALFLKNPMVTQNYYINGNMNNQQNVYLKSQINFIHLLPIGVGQNQTTIEQIKQSYLEKAPNELSTCGITASNVMMGQGKPNTNNSEKRTENKRNSEEKSPKIERKMRNLMNFPEKNKEFREILSESGIEMDFQEVRKTTGHSKWKLRRLYHKLLHRFLKASHHKHSSKTLPENTTEDNKIDIETGKPVSFAADSSERDPQKPGIEIEKIVKTDISTNEKTEKKRESGHISHKIAVFHASHELKTPIIESSSLKALSETKNQEQNPSAMQIEESKPLFQESLGTSNKVLLSSPEVTEDKCPKIEPMERKESIEEGASFKEEPMKLEEDFLKNKKMKNLLNYVMNGGDISNLYASYMRKKGLVPNPNNNAL